MSDNKTALGCFAIVCVFIVVIAMSILLIEGLSYLICIGFGLEWSWWLGLGVWAIMVLIYILGKIIF